MMAGLMLAAAGHAESSAEVSRGLGLWLTDHAYLTLPFMLLTPLILGGGVIALVPGTSRRGIQVWALVVSLVVLALSLIAAWSYQWAPPATNTVQLAGVAWWVQGLGLTFGMGIYDSISLWLLLLTTFLMPVTVLSTFSAVQERPREFYFWLLVLEAAMIGAFIATDLIFFYICFEFTLVPLYFLIGIFGSAQRGRAARIFFLYTFTGSMLTFAGVLYVAWVHAVAYGGDWTFDIRTLIDTAQTLSPYEQRLVFLALMAGFALKVPLFPFHTWLPLAHTEAPTAGSVILAGVLLKLGTYGLVRLALPMTPLAAAQWAPAVAVLAILGILYTALVCWVQQDIKKLIAYSSVSHLGFCVLGLFALNTAGGQGSVMYMVNHGLSTGALFLCVGMVYERFHTREMARMSGLARVMPVWSFFMVFFCLASVGLPGLNGFVGEFLCLLGAFDYKEGALGPAYAAIAGLGMILTAIYILHMVGKVVFGPVRLPGREQADAADHQGHAPASGEEAGHGPGEHAPANHASSADAHPRPRDLSAREITCLVPLAVACLVLGLYPAPLLRSLERPVGHITATARQGLAQTGTGRPESSRACPCPQPAGHGQISARPAGFDRPVPPPQSPEAAR